MSILIIDSGHYSVKFVEGKYQKKNFVLENVDEVFISDVRDPYDLETSILEYQQLIIKQYLEQTQFTGKIVYQIQNEFLTTRYFDLPVNNRKKAELMIPFQLDEDLPFHIADAHFTNTFHKIGNGNFSSIVQIAEMEVFKELHSSMKMNHTLPSILTSELGVFHSYIADRKFGGHICILDIGHKTTKAYLAFNDRILSNHISNTAGATIDEVISRTYDISPEDAKIYKHENAFFLTEGQLENVNAEQRDFAVLMKKSFAPLTQQVQRWLLGYRIKTGFSIEKIYITGGSANLKNIDIFLTEKLETPVEKLTIQALESQVSPEEYHGHVFPYLLGQTQKNKETPTNFLIREYASGLMNGVSMEDTFFNFYRLATIVLILCFGLAIENFVFLEKERKVFNNNITKLIKDQNLEITVQAQKSFTKKPQTIYNLISTKEKLIKADMNILKDRIEANTISPLAKLSAGIRKNEKVSLLSFESKNNMNKALFKGESERDLDQLKVLINSLNLDGIQIKDGAEALKLEVSFNSGVFQ